MKNDIEKLLEVFKALSCKPRFEIVLGLIKSQEKNVGEIAEEINMPQPNVSQHLTILKSAGIIEGYKKGTQVYYKVTDPQTEKIITALDLKYWQDLAGEK